MTIPRVASRHRPDRPGLASVHVRRRLRRRLRARPRSPGVGSRAASPRSPTWSTATPSTSLRRAVERVRLLGVDTPETVKPDTPVECFGPEASARTKELLPPGTAVRVQRDTEARDRYDRLLVYLWRGDDGLFVNQTIVAGGFARTLSIEPTPRTGRPVGGGGGGRPGRRALGHLPARRPGPGSVALAGGSVAR